MDTNQQASAIQTDELLDKGADLLRNLVSDASMGGSNSETARSARSVQAIGMFLAALVLETRALRQSQEESNRLAKLSLDDQRLR